ncbi:unnamed protein product, partial [Polarella glacialis]
ITTRARFGRAPTTLCPPKAFVQREENSRTPPAELLLSWAHGYNGSASPSSLHWISANEFVFPVAAIGVVQSLDPPKQRFFRGHSKEITCLTYNAARGICASGQSAPHSGKPFICLWRADDCRLQTVLSFHDAQILSLCFNAEGTLLFSMGRDDAHTLAVWDKLLPPQPRGRAEEQAFAASLPIVRREPISRVATGKVPAFAMVAMKTSTTSANGSSSTQFAAYDAGGAKGFGVYLKFWTCVESKASKETIVELLGKNGIFPSPGPRQVLFCSWTSQGQCIACGDDGGFYLFEGNTAFSRKICTGSLGFGIEVPNQCYLFGGKDAVIYFGDLRLPKQEKSRSGPGGKGAAVPSNDGWLTALHLKDMGGSLACVSARLRLNSAAINPDGLVLIGTADHHLLLVHAGRRRLVRVLHAAHSGEVLALCHHPNDDLRLCLTGASDGTVRFWDLEGHSPVVGRVIDFCREGPWWPAGRVTYHAGSARGVFSMAFRSSGELLAIGHGEGTLRILSFPDLQPIFETSTSKKREPLSDIKFSQQGDILAVASWDQAVYIYHLSGTLNSTVVSLQHVFRGNSSSVTHLQLSADGLTLMTNSKDNQVLFFDTFSGERLIGQMGIRDKEWDTPWTCPCGWPVIGMWAANKGFDGSDINACCTIVSESGALLASGDDDRQVKLYRFPAVAEDQGFRAYDAHAGHVTGVYFARVPPAAPPPVAVSRGRAAGAHVAPAPVQPKQTRAGWQLLSVAGDDHALLQWDVHRLLPNEEPSATRQLAWQETRSRSAAAEMQLGAQPRPKERSKSTDKASKSQPSRAVTAAAASPSPWATDVDADPPSTEFRPSSRATRAAEAPEGGLRAEVRRPPWGLLEDLPVHARSGAGGVPPAGVRQRGMQGGAQRATSDGAAGGVTAELDHHVSHISSGRPMALDLAGMSTAARDELTHHGIQRGQGSTRFATPQNSVTGIRPQSAVMSRRE